MGERGVFAAFQIFNTEGEWFAGKKMNIWSGAELYSIEK